MITWNGCMVFKKHAIEVHKTEKLLTLHKLHCHCHCQCYLQLLSVVTHVKHNFVNRVPHPKRACHLSNENWVSQLSFTYTILLLLQPFMPPPWTLSGTTRVSRYQKGKTNLDLQEQEIVSGSGISWAIFKSAPRPRQITMRAPHHSIFLQAGCPSCHPTNSVKALKV